MAELYSLTGQKLMEQPLRASGTTPLRVADLEKGVYLVRILEKEGGGSTLKLVIE
ncbi:MAG TPA: hypothetical protein DCE41_31760 [Cytophagales bacterium]|nr:hypothetical protein [Cytophagales bacterium]